MPSPELQEIPFDAIQLPEVLLRPIDPAKVTELTNSIKAQGLLQPIQVRPIAAGRFEVVFGLHRLRALERLGGKSVKCEVRELSDHQASLARLAENLARNQRVDAISEAKLFRQLLNEGMKEKGIADAIGISQQRVSSRVSLLRLEPEIQTMITSELLSPEHGYELSKLENAKTRYILAELSRKDGQGPLTLMQLREMAKETLEDLSKDERVELILMRDPMERVKRIERKLSNLDTAAREAGIGEVEDLSDWISKTHVTLEAHRDEIDFLFHRIGSNAHHAPAALEDFDNGEE